MNKFSGIIAFVIIFNLIYVNFAQATEVSERTQFLKAMGIMSFNENGSITRGEFAEAAAKMLCLTKSPPSGKMYIDVPAEYKYASEIEALSNLSYMTGFIDSTFRPNSTVGYTTAVVTLVKALGGDKIATEKGGYPTGALLVANQLGILKGIANEKIITKETTAQLIYNALYAPLIEYDGAGVKLNSGSSLLESMHKIFKKTGKVIETNISSLTGGASIVKDRIRVQFSDGTTEVLEAEKNAAGFLGYNVKLYIRYDDNEDFGQIIFIIPTSENEQLVISSKHILSVSKSEITYSLETRGKEFKAKISPLADVLYNGVGLFNFDVSDLTPKKGKIELIDTNGDKVYDVINVTDYKTVVVDNIDANSYTISGKYSGITVCFDESKTDAAVQYLKNGNPSKFSDIKKWNIVDYTESKSEGRKLINVYITEAGITGTISEMILSENEVVISQKVYRISPSIHDSAMKQLNMRNSAAFYFDINGDIEACDYTAGNKFTYGYLTGISKKVSLSNTKIKIFTSDGTFKALDVEEKFNYNGNQYFGADLAKNVLSNNIPDYTALYADNKGVIGIVPQLVTYNLNSNGVINELNTASIIQDETKFSVYAAQSSRIYGPADIRAFYSNNGTTGGTEFFVKVGAPVFVVPRDATDEDNYYIDSSGIFSKDSSYDISAYDASLVGECSILVRKINPNGGNVLFNNKQHALIVERVSLGINSKGVTVETVKGYQDGNLKTLKGTAVDSTKIRFVKGNSPANSTDTVIDGVFEGLKSGDVISYTTNKAGDVVDVALMFSPHGRPCLMPDNSIVRTPWLMMYGAGYTVTPYLGAAAQSDFPAGKNSSNPPTYTRTNSANPNAAFHAVYGKVAAKDGDIIALEFESDSSRLKASYNIAKSKVCISNSENNYSVETGSSANIMVGDKVFMQVINLDAPTVLVVR